MFTQDAGRLSARTLATKEHFARDDLGDKPLIMDWQSANNKWWIRLVAVILTVAFINQDIVWAQEGTPVWSKQSSDGYFNVTTSRDSNNNLNTNMAIPKDIATIKDVYSSKVTGSKEQGSKTIIHIQDAHSSLTAQESISSILDSLVTNYNLKLIAIEGSSGYIDTSILKTFPDEKIRNNTAKSLMSQGKMSAGEFYSITSNKNITLYGIETKDLYKENVEEFRKIYIVNQTVSKEISGLIRALDTLRDKVYSKELKSLESNSVLRKDGTTSFTERWDYIDSLASKLNISYDNYPNLKKLVESIKLEKNISFDKANKERDSLIDTISKSAIKENLEKLVLKSLSFKQGKISHGEYYLFLQIMAKDNSIDPAPYANLIKFTDYITLYESIGLLEIFKEVELLEDAIKEKLYTSPDQKRLHDTLKCANFLKEIFELKLTNSDFEYLDENLKVCNAQAISTFIRDMSKKYNLPIESGYDLDTIYSNIPIALAFYRTAEERNHAILDNTIKRMNEEGQSVAALITGGYHTKGISELLKQKETSYLVILPKFDASKGERPYAAILTNKSENDSAQLKLYAFIKEIIAVSLRKAKSEGKNVHNIAELWIETYRSNYEENMKAGLITVKSETRNTKSENKYKIQNMKNIGDDTLAIEANFPQNDIVSSVTPDEFAEAVKAEEYSIAAPIAIMFTPATEELHQQSGDAKRIALSAVAQAIIDGIENRGQLPSKFSDEWLSGVLKAKPVYKNLSTNDQAAVAHMVAEAVMSLFGKSTEISTVPPTTEAVPAQKVIAVPETVEERAGISAAASEALKPQHIETRGLAVTATKTVVIAAASVVFSYFTQNSNYTPYICIIIAAISVMHAILNIYVTISIKKALRIRAGPIAKYDRTSGKIQVEPEFYNMGWFAQQLVLLHEKTHAANLPVLSGEFFAYMLPLIGLFIKTASLKTLNSPAPATESAELQKESPSSLFEGNHDWLDSLNHLDMLLSLAEGNAPMKAKTVQLYVSSVKNLPKLKHYDKFLAKLFSVAQKHERSSYLEQEIIINILDAVMRHSQTSGEALKKACLETKAIPPSMTPILETVFKRYSWGDSSHLHFLYRNVPVIQLEEALPKLGSLTTEQIIIKLQTIFASTAEDISWFIHEILGKRDPKTFTIQDWKRLYEAMAGEYSFVQEYRLGGFRRVQGRKRFVGLLAPVSIWKPSREELIERVLKVFGFSEDGLRQVVRQVMGDTVSPGDLSNGQWLMIYNRLAASNKASFKRADSQRYKRDRGIIKRMVSKLAGYLAISLRSKSIFAMPFILLNDLASTFLGIFIRMPLHLIEIFFLRYYRGEVLYEHWHKNEDFLGPAHSEIVLRRALADIRDDRKTINDKWHVGMDGFLNRVADRTLAGNLLKATFAFVIRRFYIAVISAATLGILAPQVWQLSDWLAHTKMDLCQQKESATLRARLESAAHIMTSVIHQDQSLLDTSASQLLQIPLQGSVKLLQYMDLEDVGLLAREYTKSEFQNARLQVAAMGESLKDLSFDRYVVFRLSYLTGAISYQDTVENRLKFVEEFQSLADNKMARSKEALRAMATVLDDMEPETMACILSQTGRTDIVREILDEATWVNLTRKERLIALRELLNIKIVPKTKSVSVYDQEANEIKEPAAEFIRTKILPKNFQGDKPVGIRENSDQVLALVKYWQKTKDPNVLRAMEERYSWLDNIQDKNSSFSAGRTFFEMSRFFSLSGQEAKDSNNTEVHKKCLRLSMEAKDSGLKAAENAYGTFRALLHQEDSERTYAVEDNYPEMIHLFDEAYQVTGNKDWYAAEKHVAENIILNKVAPIKRLAPEYVERQITRPYTVFNGKEIDLFDAIRSGYPGYRLQVSQREKLPAFEVGYNEELKVPIVEGGLEAIRAVTITDEAGNPVDQLKFNYDNNSVLKTIQSEHGKLIFKTQPRKMVNTVAVYYLDAKAQIPYSMNYRYIYNPMGELQYIVKEDRVTIEENFQKHPIHIVLKDFQGRPMKDLDVPQGFRPDSGLFRAHEGLNSRMRLDVLGRTLSALHRVYCRAEAEGDWVLAADAQASAFGAVGSFYDHRGHVRHDENGRFVLYDRIDPESGEVKSITADAKGQAAILLGLASWSGRHEQARELYREGKASLIDHPDGTDTQTITLMALGEMASAPGTEAVRLPDLLEQSLQNETIGELRRYIRYGQDTVNFKFAEVNVHKILIPENRTESVLLSWEPVAFAQWYLVREYCQNDKGKWEHVKRNDQWFSTNYFSMEDKTGKAKRYVVIAFTADPVFESYKPYGGTKSLSSEPAPISKEAANPTPSKPFLIIGKRHLVGNHEEWNELGEDYEIMAKEFARFPIAHGAEWEVATDRDFKHVVKRISTEEKIPRIYLRGLPDGNYYVRLRFWSGKREEVSHELFRQDAVVIDRKTVPKPVVQEDYNGNGVQDPWETDNNNNGIFDAIRVRDRTVIAWTPAENAKFYKINIWYQDEELVRFRKGDLVTKDPFVNVREYTTNSVNRIEIIPYTSDPLIGGIPGSGSGFISIPEIPGIKNPAEVSGIEGQTSYHGGEIRWNPVPGARAYQIEVMYRDSHDEEKTEEFWAPIYATQVKPQKCAKFVKVRAWTDLHQSGGEPIGEYSQWVKVDLEFERPQPVPYASIRVSETQKPSGQKVSNLTFDPVPQAKGYWVYTKNKRGGVYSYWVRQPMDGKSPSMTFVMDADVVRIQAATRERGGEFSDVVEKNVAVAIPNDNLVVPFKFFESRCFYYDLNRVPSDGMSVYVQYATQCGNEDICEYSPTSGNYFYPTKNADRVKARIIRISPERDRVVSDWSDWQEIRFRVDLPPVVTRIERADSDPRLLVAKVPALPDPGKTIAGYEWETRLDPNDPNDEPVRYHTRAKYSGGKLIESGDHLYVSKDARYVKAKAVYLTASGEVESEKWCEPVLIKVDVNEPAGVSNIRMTEMHRISFDAHRDPRVNAYVIEATDDPSDPVALLHTYVRRVIKEEGVVVKANNFFDMPIRTKYVRVTPAIIYDDDDRVLGKTSEWFPVECKNIPVIPRMHEAHNDGRLIMCESVSLANHYLIETKDRYGMVNSVLSRSPHMVARKNFVAYRMQPLIGDYRNGEFVADAEGEPTPWKYVPEVTIPTAPTAPTGLSPYRYGQSKITGVRWTADYTDSNSGVMKYFYVVEAEDKMGNRIESELLDGMWSYVIPFDARRARIKAIKAASGPQKLYPDIDSESDWSDWINVQTGLLTLPSVKIESISETPEYFEIHIKPVEGATFYLIQRMNSDGIISEVMLQKQDMEKIKWALKVDKNEILPVAKIRVMAGYLADDSSVPIVAETPAYNHHWTDLSEKSVQRLSTPVVSGDRWQKVEPLSSQPSYRIGAFYRVYGFNSQGERYLLPKTELSVFERDTIPEGVHYLAVQAVENISHENVDNFIFGLESPLSDLVPLQKVPSANMPCQDPVPVEATVNKMIAWPKVSYEIKIQEKNAPQKSPTVIVSADPYPPDNFMSLGRDAYEVRIQKITGFEVVLTDSLGQQKVIRTKADQFAVNSSEFPGTAYDTVQVNYFTREKEDFLGEHGEWSDPKGLSVKHPGGVHPLFIRPTGENIMTAVFSDGVRADFRKSDKSLVRVTVPAQGDLDLNKVPDVYRLSPDQVFNRGEDAQEITPMGNFENKFSAYYAMRNVAQNKNWTVEAPDCFEDRPTALLGVKTTGTYRFSSKDGQARIIEDADFSLASKAYIGNNQGSIEAQWNGGRQGIDLYTRKYIAGDAKAAVLDLSATAQDNNFSDREFTLALEIDPQISGQLVRTSLHGDCRFMHFASGQFVAVHKDNLIGWYLGSDRDRVVCDPKMMNNLTEFEGSGERAVLYLTGRTGKSHDDRSRRLLLFSGEAASDAELANTIDDATRFVNDYEKSLTAFVTHAFHDGVYPREFLDFYYLRTLQNLAWNAQRQTYWEMLGSGNPKLPRNALTTNASWPGNSALMQQCNVMAYYIMTRAIGSDAINERGEGLLEQRIVPNAAWLMSMQTPTDSFWMKTGDAMRFYLFEGTVLADNMQICAAVSIPNAVVVKRGYEPIDAFTISGSGFQLQGAQGQEARQYNIHDPKMFAFNLPLPEGMVVDPSQSELNVSRHFEHRSGLCEVRENIALKKAEYAMRYSLGLQAKKPMRLDHVSVAMSYLAAEKENQHNPELFPGFPGENGLMIPGVDEVFKARYLFESAGFTDKQKGVWIDLLSLFQTGGELTARGRAVREALKKVGALGVMGWDKEGLMYLPGGIDYDRGYKVMVKIDKREGDRDADSILKFTDIRLDIPAPPDKRDLQIGDHYESPQIYFTNFWARLGITDDSGIPEDLKTMVFDWIYKMDIGDRDGLSMETDYAYTEGVIALWDTANLMVDKMLEAKREARQQDYARYRGLAAQYAASAMRGALSSRDADRSVYDLKTGLVREDIMNNKGVMRFYGTFTVAYAKARDFLERMKGVEVREGLALFVDADQRPASIYDVLIREAEAIAASYGTKMKSAHDSKAYLRAKSYWEVYLSKAAKFRVLKIADDLTALQNLIDQTSRSLDGENDPEVIKAKKLLIYQAEQQLCYSRSLTNYPGEIQKGYSTDYWFREILYNADKILKLQETNKQRMNYGGFYQNEQPSKAQLDDNGTKLWALRCAYEAVNDQIDQIIKRAGTQTVKVARLAELYRLRQSYAEAARLNIGNWVRIDGRDGHLYGWESPDREEDYDTQRTPYGNETYRLRGLGSWLDIMPEARVKFDLSSRQHLEERPDCRRMWTPRGPKMNISYDPPDDGDDTSTEVAATAVMGSFARSLGGTFNDNPPEVNLLSEKEKEPLAIESKSQLPRKSFFTTVLTDILIVYQWLCELTIIKFIMRESLKRLKQAWTGFAGKRISNRYIFYNIAITLITIGLVGSIVSLFNLDKTNWFVLVIMMSGSAYALKNVAETLVRYFRIFMVTERPIPAAGETSNAALDARPFRYGPKHLQTALSVPLYTTGEDAFTSHGYPDESRGAFHNSVMKNMESNNPMLVFHINDQSPDLKNGDIFNPKVFHENYIRAMAERYPNQSFFYTHQAGNTDKKFGAVQAMDIWWYAFKDNIRYIINDAWTNLNDEQRRNLRREAYGITEQIPARVVGGEEIINLPGSDLVIRIHPDRTADLTLREQCKNGIFLVNGLALPVGQGEEVRTVLRVPRRDGLTALLPVIIRCENENYLIYHYNEDPDSHNVLIDEVIQGRTQTRDGLLPHEKGAMIEEEARALLYWFWASEYGSVETSGDDTVHKLNVTSGRSRFLNEAGRLSIRNALRAGGRDADLIFVSGGICNRLSNVMVNQSTNYFSKVADIPVRNGPDIQSHSKQRSLQLASLFPQAFDSRTRVWLDAGLFKADQAVPDTAPSETEVGKRIIPGRYYHINPEGTGLEIYDNPALNVIDQTARAIEAIQNDSLLNVYGKKTKAERYLQDANQVLRNIIEIMPVKTDFKVRYNPVSGQTEILEERWIMYQYVNADGSREAFFRPERIIRCDTVVGHLPSIGPVSYMWRMDNDGTVDLAKGEGGTLDRGPLMAGHPRYQPVTEPGSGRTIMGYGGMVLPYAVGNANSSIWTQIANRNRNKLTWDLRHQWLGFGEAQYTGAGIENLDSAARSKAYTLAKGFYLSHDTREQGGLGSGIESIEPFRELRKRGLAGAFLQGRSHPRFGELENYIRTHFTYAADLSHVIFRKYGREMTIEEFLELLSFGARQGGMGLLDGMQGFEEWFESLNQEWEKVMGIWKRGNNQWLHSGFGGMDIRGLARLPGAAPGFIISERRSMEQTVVVNGNNICRLFTGQQYRPSLLNDVQKYFITRTFEEDQRNAVMLLWIVGTLILAALNGNLYVFLNFPIVGYSILFVIIGIIVGIMKFGTISQDIKQEGLTLRNTRAVIYALKDTLTETIIISGLNLWKAMVTTCQLTFRAPIMKWVTRAELKNMEGFRAFIGTYGVSILLGLSIISFVAVLHPTWSWLIFGSVFLASLIFGPILERITAMKPVRARATMRTALALVVVLAVSFLYASYESPQIASLISTGNLMLVCLSVGKISLAVLAGIAVIKISMRIISGGIGRTIAVLKSGRSWLSAIWGWFAGLLLLTIHFDVRFVLGYAARKNFQALYQLRERLIPASVKNYFLTSGIDPGDFFPNRNKAFANLGMMVFLWTLPLLFPQPFLALALGYVKFQIILSAAYMGMFFPVGFWALDHILSPHRIYRIYNPIDWLKTAFHLTTGIAGMIFTLFRDLAGIVKDILMAPYYCALINRFVKSDLSLFSTEDANRLAREASIVLKYAPRSFNKRLMRNLVHATNTGAKLIALTNSGMLDHKDIKDLSEIFPATSSASSAISYTNLIVAFLGLVMWPFIAHIYGYYANVTPQVVAIVAAIYATSFFIHELGHAIYNKLTGKPVSILFSKDILTSGISIKNSSPWAGIAGSLIFGAILTTGLILFAPHYIIPALIINIVFALSAGDLRNILKLNRRFVIGIPEGRNKAETEARKAAIINAIGGNCEINSYKDSTEFAALIQPGIYIDDTIPDSCILEAVTAAMSQINSGQSERIAKLVVKIIGPIESVKPAEIFASVQKKLAENTPSASILSELKSSIKVQHETFVTYFNKNARELDATISNLNPNVKQAMPVQKEIVVSAVTDTVAIEDPTFRESVARNRTNNLKTALILGGVFLTIKEAEAFVTANGMDTKDVEFIDGRRNQDRSLKYDDVIIAIQEKFPRIKAESIGVRAAEEEVEPKDKVIKGKLLLVRRAELNGRSVLLAMNSEKVLLNLIFAGTNAGELKIPGLSYDEMRKIFIFAPIVPKDYGKEIEAYRNAIMLLSSAA